MPDQTFTVTEHTWIPMTDGVRLSARLWIPSAAIDDDARRPPVVLEYIPYRKRDRYRSADSFWGKVLASRGIAFARVDVRGTGDSEGVMTDEYADLEIDDGMTLISWLAAQSWNSGAVGMRGISWGAINTLQIAARRPEALKAIIAIAGTDNRYTDDAHYIGGAISHNGFQWGTLFKGVMAGPPDPAVVGDAWYDMWRERLEATPDILARWATHQHCDSYWQQGVTADALIDNIAVPTYLVAGWQDTYANPVGRMLGQLQSPHKALIGPWGHTYPYFATPIGLDWSFEELRWWSHWLEGESNGVMDEPVLHAYMPYATARQAEPKPIPGRWIAERCWPPTSTTDQDWWLNSNGLAAVPGDHEPLLIRGDRVVGLTKPEWLDRLPIEQSHDDALSLTFDSHPLRDPIEVLGNGRVSLELSADAEVATVAARLCEVTADGKSWLVSFGLLNLTHRDSHEHPSALPAGKFSVEVPLAMVAHRFAAGSRIRVALSQSLWPLTWPAPKAYTLTVTTGASRLLLPVRAGPSEPIDLPIPVVVRNGSDPATFEVAAADPQGCLKITNNSPAIATTSAEVGTQMEQEKTEQSEIVEGSPNSARWQQNSTTRWRRDDWQCEVSAGYELTSDENEFRLREWLIARHRDKTIFERDTDHRIQRNLV